MQSIWDAASDRDYYGEQYEELEEHDGDEFKESKMNLTDSEIEALWDKGNDEGNGYSVGGDKMTPREAAEDEGFTDIRTFDTSTSTSHCVIARDGGDWVAICDANGPWAVTVKECARG
jgi:hypothetical protein